jgi:hypothetical protein
MPHGGKIQFYGKISKEAVSIEKRLRVEIVDTKDESLFA